MRLTILQALCVSVFLQGVYILRSLKIPGGDFWKTPRRKNKDYNETPTKGTPMTIEGEAVEETDAATEITKADWKALGKTIAKRAALTVVVAGAIYVTARVIERALSSDDETPEIES